MNRSIITLAVVALITLTLAGCELNRGTPTRPAEPAEFQSASGQAKGGNGGGGSGGGAELKSVQLAGGMSGGPEDVPIQNDNKRELNLQGPMTGVFTTIDASGCTAIKGSPTPAEQAALEALLSSGPIDPFRFVMIYDKRAAGAISNNHRLTLNFEQPSGNGNYIVNVTEGVTAGQSGNIYTYSGGYVRVQDSRGPKDTVIIRCDNLSTITVTLDDV